MLAKVAHVYGDEQQPLRQQGSEQRNDAEVPDLAGVQAGAVRGALRDEQPRQHSERSNCAVGRNDKSANVKEDRMHLSKHTAFDRGAAALVLSKGARKGGRIRPTGP